MVEIKLSEKEKKIFEKALRKEVYNMGTKEEKIYEVDNTYYLLDGVHGEDNRLRKELLEVFFDKILQTIKDNPGISQKSLYKGLFEKGKYLSTFFYLAEKKGIIRRIKSRSTYKLYMDIDMTKEEFLKEWERADVNKMVEVYYHRNSNHIIMDYFGSTLKKIYQFHKYGTHEGASYRLSNKACIKFLHDVCNDGATIEFEMNKPLEKVIGMYWSKECDDALKRFLLKYGFFADKIFIDLRLKEILGEEKLSKLRHELRGNHNHL